MPDISVTFEVLNLFRFSIVVRTGQAMKSAFISVTFEVSTADGKMIFVSCALFMNIPAMDVTFEKLKEDRSRVLNSPRAQTPFPLFPRMMVSFHCPSAANMQVISVAFAVLKFDRSGSPARSS